VEAAVHPKWFRTLNPFFANSDLLDREVLRPLSHIYGNWELDWNKETNEYMAEEGSYASLLNKLIAEIDSTSPPARYHDNEDRLAEYVREHLKWKIHKEDNRWVGEDYEWIIEQGGFDDLNEQHLIQAAAGRVRAATDHGQKHYDEMEESHRLMLAAVLSIILYHRTPLEA
jgi:hypothetical protein